MQVDRSGEGDFWDLERCRKEAFRRVTLLV